MPGYVTAYDAATGKQLWRFFTGRGNVLWLTQRMRVHSSNMQSPPAESHHTKIF